MAASHSICIFISIFILLLSPQLSHSNEPTEGSIEDVQEPDTREEAKAEFDYEEEASVNDVEEEYSDEENEPAVSQMPSTDGTALPVSTGTSRAPTLQDILSGLDPDAPLPPHLQLTLVNSNMSALNLTTNLTAEAKRVNCRPRNVSALNETDMYVPMVKLVTSKELLQRLSITNDTHANCIIVLLYAPWCPFCAKVAPHFNALPKVFPQIDFMAIDAINFNNLNVRFGTTSVPNLLFFHKSKVTRLNSTIRTIDEMATCIKNITSLDYNNSLLTVSDLDYIGPLSSIPTEERDFLLWLSWIFIISFSSYMFSRSTSGVRLWNYVNSFGAVHEHHHID